MRDWKHTLKADPTEWLLEMENSPVRYWTLVDILNRPSDNLEVRAAQAAIPTYPLWLNCWRPRRVMGIGSSEITTCPGPVVVPSGC